MPTAPAGPAAGPRLADDLARLLTLADGESLPIGRVVATMEDRGYALAVSFLAFPFVLPIPSLGMSAPIGFFLALAGLALVRGGTPSLPAFLERRHVAYAALRAMAAGLERARRISGHVLRPRWEALLGGRARIAIGVSLSVSAIVLALPIPLPLSNFFPAAAILMLALGLLEGDGLMVVAGHVSTAAIVLGLYLAWGVAQAGALRLLSWAL